MKSKQIKRLNFPSYHQIIRILKNNRNFRYILSGLFLAIFLLLLSWIKNPLLYPSHNQIFLPLEPLHDPIFNPKGQSNSLFKKDSLFFQYSKNMRLIYEFIYKEASQFDLANLFPKHHSLSSMGTKQQSLLSLEGQWIMTVIQQNDKTSHLAIFAHFTDLKIYEGETLLENLKETKMEILKSDLETPFFVEIDSFGKIISMNFPAFYNLITKNFVREFLTSLQLIFPEQTLARNKGYQILEKDPRGSYIASYQVKLDKNLYPILKVQKTEKKYAPSTMMNKAYVAQEGDLFPLPPLGQTLGIKQNIVSEIKYEYLFDLEKHILQSLKGEEHLSYYVQNFPVGSSSHGIDFSLLMLGKISDEDVLHLTRPAPSPLN